MMPRGSASRRTSRDRGRAVRGEPMIGSASRRTSRDRGRAVRGELMIAALVLLVALASPGAAAEWREIKPGETQMAEIRARFGAPTKATPVKVEGFDTTEWVYEGAQALVGMARVTLEFGFKAPS